MSNLQKWRDMVSMLVEDAASDGVIVEVWQARKVAGDVSTMPLTLSAEQWRTPSAGDPEGGVMELREGADARLKLRDDAVGWSTPNATAADKDRYSESQLRRNTPGIQMEAIIWATPTANSAQNPGSLLRDASLPLADMSAAWSTPQAFDAKDVTGLTQTEVAGCRTLANDLAAYSLPLETQTVNGSKPSWSGRTSARRYRALRLIRARFQTRLNPLFGEWLMGWPGRWSDAPKDSALSETELCHYRRQLLTAFCSLLSGVTSDLP